MIELFWPFSSSSCARGVRYLLLPIGPHWHALAMSTRRGQGALYEKVELQPLPSPRLQPRKVERTHHGLNTTVCGLNVTTPKPVKALSLRQLRDVLDALTNSKRKKDLRCMALGRSQETMEQHLYAFLSVRYAGQESVVKEWVQAIFRSTDRWVYQDCTVYMFSLILQNKLPETFPAIMDTLKAQLDILVKKMVNERHGDTHVFNLDAIVTDLQIHGMYLDDHDYILRHVFADNDCDEIMDVLEEMVEDKLETARRRNVEPELRIKIYDVLQVCYRKQIQLMCKFLERFQELFLLVDKDQDGVLSASELVDLMENILAEVPPQNKKIAEAEKISLLGELQGRASATYSQTAGLFQGLIAAMELDDDDDLRRMVVTE